MDIRKLEILLNELNSQAKLLATTVENTIPNVRQVIQSDESLPTGCRSKASLAEKELRQIQKNLVEVNGIYRTIFEHLLKMHQQTVDKINIEQRKTA